MFYDIYKALCEQRGVSLSRAAAEMNDSRLCYLPLPAATAGTLGARRHPGVECHRQAAQALTTCLRSILPPRG